MTTDTAPAVETRQDLRTAILHQLSPDEYVHAKHIAQRLGFRDDRVIRAEIVRMRRAGMLIISNTQGHRLARDVNDIIKAKEFLQGYVISLCRVMRDYKNLLNNVNGQMKMRME